MRLYSMLTGLLLFSVLVSYGQKQEAVVGTVIDNLNQPVPGAVIKVKHEGKVTSSKITKQDGGFLILAEDLNKDSLEISSVGYLRQMIGLDGQRSLRVLLKQNTNNLDDVTVVSALGLTRSLNSVTYSRQAVDADEMTEARDVNITNMLAGKVAGLQVTTTGQPGSSTRVVLRGPKSVTGNNQPLWVLDGVPIANNSGDGRGDNLDYGNGAQDLNPDDIESIEVLEGPNAAALYGSEAANGAILITTKKGNASNKDWGISVNQNLMAYTVTQFPEYQNVYGEGGNNNLVTNVNKLVPGMGGVKMGGTNNNQSWGAPMLGQPYIFNDGTMGSYSPQPSNVEAMYKTAFTNTSNISISKADANSSYRLSYTFTNGNDVIENQNKMQRHNVNLYATRKLNSKLSIDARMLYTRTDTKNRTYRNLDADNPMAAYVFFPRSAQLEGMKPWRDPVTGNAISLGTFASDIENPYWALYENSNEDINDRLVGGVTANLTLTSYLKFRTQATLDYEYKYAYQYKELGGAKRPNGYYYNQNQTNQHWNYEALLMFNRKIAKDFNLSANLGTNYRTSISTDKNQFVDQLLVHDMPSMSNANAVPTVREGMNRDRRFSVYGSANLGYKNYLYLDFTGRNDWSSTLPIENNSYFYPSTGLSFVFSNVIKNKDILSYGKLRASYAGVGNSAPFASLYNTFRSLGLFNGNPTLVYEDRLKNANLKPEKTNSKEIGLDLGFLKDQRVKLTASIYKSNTYNQIITAQALPETGYNNMVLNAGNIENKGIELTFNADIIKGKDFQWSVGGNWSKNVNKVVSLAPGIDRVQLGQNLGITVFAIEGLPYGELVGGVPYMVGDTMIVQTNGKAYFDQNINVGNGLPDWIGALNTSFSYKGFDLSLLFTFKYGGNIYSASYARANAAGNTLYSLWGRDAYYFSDKVLGESGDERRGWGQMDNGIRTDYGDGREKGAKYNVSYFPKVDANGQVVIGPDGRMVPGEENTIWSNPQDIMSNMTTNLASPMVFDATSIRLSQLILGYTFPKTMLKSGFIKDLRVAFTGRNLWQIVQHTPIGIDPESANTSGNSQGIEAGGSFPYAQYAFDVKFSF